MNLESQNATYRDGDLWFDCPCGKEHNGKKLRIVIRTDESKLSVKKFAVVGVFPKISLHPEIVTKACGTFYIDKGEIIPGKREDQSEAT
jgi:hypothetical protein